MTSLVHRAAAGEDTFVSPPGMELSDFASESVVVSDEHGVIKYWNAASEALYGWPAMAMIGQNLATLRTPGQHESEQESALLREGRWEGLIRRRSLTGSDVTAAGRWPLERDPYLLETSVPGIFACGDVRYSPVKRVAAAVGEGSMAIAFVHQYLREAGRADGT